MNAKMPMSPTLLRTPLRNIGSYRQVVAGNVRAVWGRSRLTISDMARVLGCCHATASSRYHGRSAFRVDELETLAVMSGCKVSEFFAAAPEDDA